MSGQQALRLLAVGCFGLAASLPPLSSVGAALVGLALLALSLLSISVRSATGPGWIRIPVFGLVIVTGFLGLVRGATGYPEPAGAAPLVFSLGVAITAGLLVMNRASFDRVASVLAIAVVAVFAVGVMVQFGGNLYGLDVYRSHEAAADALADGQNPYGQAVRVANGSPNAEPGEMIEGYAYPPVTLIAYAAGDWLGGDPRWASVLAVVAGLAVMWLVGGAKSGGLAVCGALVLLAAMPLNRAIVWSGWTEPLTFALLLVALWLWPRPVVAGVVLGLALATKQYLVVLAPLFIVAEGRPWRRSGIAGAVVVATMIPAAVVDFDSFWFTMIERPLGLGFRPDSQSLSGAIASFGHSYEVPAWLMVLVVVGIGVAIGRRVLDTADLAAGVALVLGVAFLLSLAFVNYWWLVQWVIAASVAFGARAETASSEPGSTTRNVVGP